ncbi:MAG: RsmB/NOP family class I SAM-dependent RNA methyltransferase [Candidatus Micrarchaeota archaeon]
MEEREYRDWMASYTDYDKCNFAFCNQKQFFRINTIKIDKEKLLERTTLDITENKYYEFAFEFDKKVQIGKTWEYFLGYIYPQSLPSILVSLVLEPEHDDIVLDVAAAPGSKFSHMAMLMENNGVLVGNDLTPEKISTLYSTINRMNILNSITTMHHGANLNWKSRFTKILVDAPCTALGSGMKAFSRWEIGNSEKISSLQKRMLFSAYDALRPGGELVYSTCTYAKEENEEVVANLLNNLNAKLVDIKLDIPHEHGLSEYGKEFRKCYRIYPQHLESEGFFIAKIKKGE